MSADDPEKSHGATWTITIAAVLLTYVASIGPVVGLFVNGTYRQPAPEWLNVLYSPIHLLSGTPLQKPLEAYITWWVKVLKKP